MDLIYYHANCTDGWTAAYIASKKYPEAKLVPAFYSTEPPYKEVEGKDVLMVDFCWKTRKVNIFLKLLAKSLTIFEHHKGANEDLAGLEWFVYDVTRSGAGLTFDYLFGKDSDDTSGVLHGLEGDNLPRPWYVNYVEDYDIWTKKLPRTEEINAYLHAQPHTKEAWDAIAELDPTMAVRFGIGSKLVIDSQATRLVKAANKGSMFGMTVGIVNAPMFLASEIGHELSKTVDIGICWVVRQDGKVSFGLRSAGDIDVCAVAKRFGGGGHKNSAGFEQEFFEGMSLIRTIIGKDGYGEHQWDLRKL